MKSWTQTCKYGLTILLGAVSIILSGCVTDQDKINAINALNASFRADYEKILADKGSRTFKLNSHDVFVAMRVAMAGLRMRTENQDESLGHLVVVGAAPLPFDDMEWQRASNADLPLLRSIIAPYVGSFSASFVHFEPQGLEVVIGTTFVETANGTEVSLTARLREIAPPRSGWPRREYLSPTVVNTGLDKIWAALLQELRAGPTRLQGSATEAAPANLNSDIRARERAA
jgi:hypothetical protein